MSVSIADNETQIVGTTKKVRHEFGRRVIRFLRLLHTTSLIRDYGNIENVLSLFDGDIVCFQVSFSFEWKHRKVV